MSTVRLPVAVSIPCRPEDLLALQRVDSGPVTVIEVAGELDMATAPLLTDLADAILAGQAQMIVLDLAKLQFLCADGLRALLHTRNAAAAHTVQLILLDPSPITCRLLTITGVLDAFQVRTNPANA
jgi:anti-sigma B factor antagonist